MSPIATTSHRRFGVAWLGALVVLAVGWPLLTAGLINDYSRADSNFINALYLRKDIAMREHALEGPARLVIVGGSESLFGIDAAQIERALSIPTVNYATHAGLGIPYLLDRAKRVLRPGDTVLLSLAYGMWTYPQGEFQDIEFSYFTSYDKAYYLQMGWRRALTTLYSIPLKQYWPSIEGMVRYWRGRHLHLERMYDVAHIDPHGDIQMVMPGRKHFFEHPHVPMPRQLPRRESDALRAFSQWARQNRIRLLFTWPNVSRPTEMTDRPLAPSPALLALFTECGIEMVDAPADNVLPREWFFDTDKHLNSTGRRIRTQALIGALAGTIGQSAPLPDDAPWMVMAGPNAGLERLDELPRTPVRFVYLEESPSSPGGMTPHDLKEAVRAGQVAWYDDRHVEPLLLAAGLRGERVLRIKQTLTEWMAPLEDHVLVCLRPTDEPWPEQATHGAPEALKKALTAPGPFALVVGTGKYGRIARSFKPGKEHTFELGKLLGRDTPPMQVLLRVPPTDRPGEPLRNMLIVNGRELAQSSRGLRIVAISPHRSSIVASAVFDAPGARAVVSERYRVIPATEEKLAWEPVSLQALVQAGPFPLKIQRTEEGVWFESDGKIGYRPSVVGVDLSPYLADGGSFVVRLTVQGPPGTTCRSAVSTSRPELFSFLPQSLIVHCTDGARTVDLRVVLRPGGVLSPRDTAVVGMSAEIGAPPVRITHASIARVPSMD